ncbi:sodium:proton exchanger, partial [Candidatus Uhrbacteria bacterium]|nr:sodium:proton exchanger [Candidatus Uhrbacteria bacterium]MBD3283874.1 sodium:proton exchanger [Candidatus Uhrbacteria bacterium]
MEIFLEISIIIAIAAAVALVMQLLRLPLLLGHIITGIIVGPAAMNILHSGEALEVFSHLGITSLLFIVGLSLSPKVIREVGKVALVAGIGQVVFTVILGFLISLTFGFNTLTSVYLAVAFTFSSTIIISKLLSDKRDTNTLYGKIAIGMLLVQDVIATIVLI